jgi:hypothetical protein
VFVCGGVFLFGLWPTKDFVDTTKLFVDTASP